MPSAPFVSKVITDTLVQETDTTLPVTVTKDTNLPIPGATTGASTAVSGITVTPASGGGVVIAASTATGGSGAREQDVTATTTVSKVTQTTSSVTTVPATTNQYEHARWIVSPEFPTASILTLQMLGVSATYMTLYRVTVDEGSNAVTVQMRQGQITLQPGTSADISAQQITIASLNNLPAVGSFQNLCCATVTQAQASKGSGGGAAAATGAQAGGGGGGLIDLGGGDDFPQLTFPDANPPDTSQGSFGVDTPSFF
jgi:hypothetical protein